MKGLFTYCFVVYSHEERDDNVNSFFLYSVLQESSNLDLFNLSMVCNSGEETGRCIKFLYSLKPFDNSLFSFLFSINRRHG